jgi:uncharacterized protein (DUF1501 family)
MTMRLARRTLLKGVAAAFAAGAVGTLVSRRLAFSVGRKRAPRYVVQIVLRGGFDAVYTTDPKTREEVAPGVDVPYPASAITRAGGLALGPHFAPLAKFAEDMVVLNGIHFDTANHEAGMLNATRMRTGAALEMPSLLEIIAQRESDAAVPLVSLGFHSAFGVLGGVHETALKVIEETPPDDLRILAATLRSQSRELSTLAPRASTASAGATRRALDDGARLFERCADLPSFEAKATNGERSGDHDGESFAESFFEKRFQRAQWLLQNDLCQCAFIGLRDWDTHFHNGLQQTNMAKKVVPEIARFLDALKAGENKHGNLLDNTLVIIGSEIGRLPFLNTLAGKDHFPECPYLFIGGGMNRAHGNAFGQTDKTMAAMPISLSTGRAAAGGIKPTITDVGATLLQHAGLNPNNFGFRGRVLEFMGA